ncbi:short-chain collagen C4-like [Mytilus trossulus]|uniref:short-chain collagen C4-like n=1 Tax=Mytilus trossulus TaxID=6551 RepID=UPI0030065320
MLTFSFATTIVAFVVSVYGNDCKEYNLTPSDQSLIDMMKHYLHTSRKADTVAQSNQDIGVTYVRWGKKTCPKGAGLVYTGQAGGNFYTNKGGGSNYLCLPSDPENGKVTSNDNDGLYGAEYDTWSTNKPSGFRSKMLQKEAPCAVCRRTGKVSVLMIPGRKTCYKGWKSEYHGFLMSQHKRYNQMDFICMDAEAEPLDNQSANNNGALFYPIKAKCGSLRCPPYKDNTEVLCAVCSK